MKKIRAAVVGYGNIGRFTVEALEAAKDFEIAGVVRRKGAEDKPLELTPYEVVSDIRELKDVDVAILATPTRSCEEYAKQILPLGINTVDSFDIHTNIRGYRERLMEVCKQTGTVAVIAAGWDPGSDSIVRTLMQSLAPKGLSYTNFGPGMSMGHSVCVRSKEGVKNALSVTIPLGEGIHRRMVYVELEDGARLEDVTAAIKADPYFANDETHVFAVASVDDVRDMGHGVNLEPAFRVQYADQQPRPHGSGVGECGSCIAASAARLLHDGRAACHRHAARRACRPHRTSRVSSLVLP